jgi:4-amino-4-deoxy-L-arabinose transferase-like glycosyltransferase
MKNTALKITSLKYFEYLIFSLIICIGFFFRLYKIENPVADWHSFRQADTSSVSMLYVKNGINLLYPKYHDLSSTQSGLFNPEGYRFVEFPIYNVIQAYSFMHFGFFSLEVWGRLLSVLSSLISTFLIYILGKRFIGKWGGLIAALLFATLPYNVYFSRVILPEPLAVMLALSGLTLFVNYHDNEKLLKLALSAIFFSLAILVKPYTVFYLVPVLYLAIKKYGLKKAIRKLPFWFFSLIILVPFFAWRWWIGQHPEGIPFWKWTFNGDGIRFKPAFWKWIFGERLTKLILGFWGLVLFVFGLLDYKKTKAFIFWFIGAMFLYVSVVATANVKHDYYQTLIVPAVVLIVANGILSLWNNHQFPSKITKAILIFSILIMFSSAYSDVKEDYKINRPEIIEAGVAADVLLPKDAIVIAPYNGDTAFLYQTKRLGWPVVDRPIDELIAKGVQYYISVDLNHPQTQEYMRRFRILKQTNDYIIIQLIAS